jgi:hypothetical protein
MRRSIHVSAVYVHLVATDLVVHDRALPTFDLLLPESGPTVQWQQHQMQVHAKVHVIHTHTIAISP